MKDKLSAIRAVITSEHYVVITIKRQVACTPKTASKEYWKVFDILWNNTKKKTNTQAEEKKDGKLSEVR